MDKTPITNTTAMPIYVHGVMIPPGETRHFNAADVPPAFIPQAAAAEEAEEEPPAAINPITELLAQPVKAIIAALPDLSEEDMGDLESMEHAAEKPRSTLLEAIAADRLKRAGGKDA